MVGRGGGRLHEVEEGVGDEGVLLDVLEPQIHQVLRRVDLTQDEREARGHRVQLERVRVQQDLDVRSRRAAARRRGGAAAAPARLERGEGHAGHEEVVVLHALERLFHPRHLRELVRCAPLEHEDAVEQRGRHVARRPQPRNGVARLVPGVLELH